MLHYEIKEQDIIAFANSQGIRAKKVGEECAFLYCPYCRGGASKDKWTFYVNTKTGQYECKRSSCRVKGNMITLARDFDFQLSDEFSNFYRKKPQYRTLPQPKEEIIPKAPAVEFLRGRGISEETAKAYRVTVQTDNESVMCFPIFDPSGKMVNVKYRNLNYTKDKQNGVKEWYEQNCMPYLYGVQVWDGSYETMVLCEGQLDAMACHEAGIRNAFSVPGGAKGFTWYPPSYEFVSSFPEMIIFGDFENGTITLLDEMKQRFGGVIKHVRPEDYLDCKDANEILLKYGREQILKCIANAVILPAAEIIELADVEDVDISKLEKLPTGIKQVDRLLYGGLPFGGVHLIAGKPGEGKLLADDTPVFTLHGWKKHGDLAVGDKVIGRHGEFVKVTHVFPKAYANMRVTLNNNETFYCHENHEWVTNFHSGNGYKEKIRTTKEIMEWKEKTHCHPARLIQREPLQGKQMRLYVKPYTLGAWLGDGRNNNPDICASEKDSCVIDRVLKDGYRVAWKTVHKDTGVLYFGFKNLRNQLHKYGMCNSKKRIPKKIPQDYLIAPLNDRLELLAGLLDTDGYYDNVKHGYIFSTAEESLRDSFTDLVHTFGWNCYCRTVEPRVSSSGIVGRKNTYNISFVPIGLRIPCVIERKQQDLIKTHSKRQTAIEKIEYCEPIQGNCIEVEGGVYCVGKTMIPTHNSTLASQILVGAVERGYKCFAYSGELPNYLFKAWMLFQIAGGNHVFEYGDGTYEQKGYSISTANKNVISTWLRGKAFLYDNTQIGDDEKESLVKTVEKAIHQYGCRVILIDNLMTALDLEHLSGDDQYERQSKFVKKLTRMAMKYNALILLVAHKRKNNISTNANDEIAGSSNIANLAMVTLAYDRDKDIPDENRLIRIAKNRLFGKINLDGFEVKYDERSKRIFGNGDNPDIEYSCFKTEDGFVTDEFMAIPF